MGYLGPHTVLPVWTESKGVSGYYGPNSLVYYQRNPDTAGYAYRAKSTYISSDIPPDRDANWEIDYTYAPEWKADGKYRYNSRVCYFNGQYTYTYVASLRYYGGQGKPNEEVDEDGIRTWELESSYRYLYNNSYNFYHTFLFPVRKVGGYTGGADAWPMNPLSPEERFEQIYWQDYYGSYTSYNYILENYLLNNGYLKKDFSDVNSKYQSHAYDSMTYNFYEDKYASGGVQVNRKKGIHWAKWYKGIYNGKYPYEHAESQVMWTRRAYYYNYSYYGYGQLNYFDINGFAIEMWPSIEDSEFTYCIKTINDTYYNSYYYNNYWFWYGSSGAGSYTPYCVFGKPHTGGWSYYYGSISMNGEWRDPNGELEANDSPPDDECKASLAFARTLPMYSDLNCTYYLGVAIQQQKWAVYNYSDPPTYYTENDGDVQYSWRPESLTTKDDDFNCSLVYNPNYVRAIENGKAVDLAGYKTGLNITTVFYAGFKIE